MSLGKQKFFSWSFWDYLLVSIEIFLHIFAVLDKIKVLSLYFSPKVTYPERLYDVKIMKIRAIPNLYIMPKIFPLSRLFFHMLLHRSASTAVYCIRWASFSRKNVHVSEKITQRS